MNKYLAQYLSHSELINISDLTSQKTSCLDSLVNGFSTQVSIGN